MVASAINETNEMSGSKSFVLELTLTGDNIIGAADVSPVVDVKKLSGSSLNTKQNV